ncbi:alpha/beta hydrolase [Bosea caraganae]|uniref:Alpha/beta hydrolase n=1 Tax=Bosea caraganae TaxID=2763117 RepID=A0A370L9P2_9HYPH|nr:alpha/beta fold hydrolase [Bosea caraganae]RDJ26997.1 alpha/beta hydrolase [Bosea caraganae]RDJ30882.1 alpha/beta hydrolase [Bosea caraganae]
MTEIIGEEHRASKGAVSLFLWRKRLAGPAPEAGRPAVILVHGSSMSSLPSFDLTVPGCPDYSFMDWLARRGWDVWTLDHEGYGHSTITEGNSDIATGVADLIAATDEITRLTGATSFHVYGLSSGALRAAGFAQAAPERVARLVLDAFVWTGKDSPTLGKRREGIEFFRTHNRRPIDRKFIESIFTRDLPGTSEQAVIEACAEAQCAYADSVPTGTYLDMTTKLPIVDPEKIAAPTLIVRGEHDGIATVEDVLAFFQRLPAGDKRIAILPGLAHSTPLGIYRHRMWDAVEQFLRS